MKHLQTYENFKPIKVNNQKPFKVKKNLAKSMHILNNEISSLRKRIESTKRVRKGHKSHAEMNKSKNQKIQKLKDLQLHSLKQAEYLKQQPKD